MLDVDSPESYPNHKQTEKAAALLRIEKMTVKEAVVMALGEVKIIKRVPAGTPNRAARAGIIRRLTKRLVEAGVEPTKAQCAAYKFASSYIH